MLFIVIDRKLEYNTDRPFKARVKYMQYETAQDSTIRKLKAQRISPISQDIGQKQKFVKQQHADG